mgnify:CR=1 FL=1
MRKGQLEATVELLQTQLAEEQATSATLRGRLAEQGAADNLVELAKVEIKNAETMAAIGSEATTIAKIAVMGAVKEQLTTELAAQIKDDKYDEFAAEVRIEEGPKIIVQLKDLFEADGTFDRLRAEAEDEVRAALQAEVLAEERAKIDTELGTLEYRSQMKDQIRTELLATDEMERYRAAEAERMRAAWIGEVQDEVHRQITQEEQGRETDFKAAHKAELLQSRWAANQRSAQRNGLEEKWKKKTTEEVAEQIGDEELMALLKERADLEKEDMRKRHEAARILAAFKGRGVNMDDLEKDTRVEIFLGEIKNYKVTEKYRDTYDYVREREAIKPGVACRRKLTLIAEGDGTFLVDDDSLLDSDSAYEQNDALHRGTIIKIGRRTSKNGEYKLENRVVADVPLYYDDNTEQPNITDATYPVANIRINGVDAIEIAKVEML